MLRAGSFFVLSVLWLFAWVGPLGGAEQMPHRTGAEMHHPKAWQFAIPKGDPVKGRAIFQKFECYACHEVGARASGARRRCGRAGVEPDGPAASA